MFEHSQVLLNGVIFHKNWRNPPSYLAFWTSRASDPQGGSGSALLEPGLLLNQRPGWTTIDEFPPIIGCSNQLANIEIAKTIQLTPNRSLTNLWQMILSFTVGCSLNQKFFQVARGNGSVLSIHTLIQRVTKGDGHLLRNFTSEHVWCIVIMKLQQEECNDQKLKKLYWWSVTPAWMAKRL